MLTDLMLSMSNSLPQQASPLAGFLVGSVVVGVGVYLLAGWVIYTRYYRSRQAEAARWKCQPERWPSPAVRRYDLRLGMFNITLGSLLSGLLAWAIATGRFSGGAYLSLAGHGLLRAV